MRPRNPLAILAAVTATAVVGPVAADAGSSLACARPKGDCSERKLAGRHFERMELSRSQWMLSSLTNASFRNSNLYDSSFRGAVLRKADLSFGNRAWSNFRGADLSGADLSRSDFFRSNFRGADLRGARIVGTKLDGSDLTNANFEGAFMKESSFRNITLCKTIQPNGEERNDNCPGSGNGGNRPGGGLCCFPGGKDKDKGKGDENGGNGNADEPIVGELRALRP